MLHFGIGHLRRVRTAGSSAALSLNFLSGLLDSRVTFSRASHATMFDSTGKLTYAPNNLVLQSQTLQTTWGATNVSVTANTTTAPDGTNTADTITLTGATVNKALGQTVTAVAGKYIFSAYLKYETHRYIQLTLSSETFYANFDLQTGVVSASSGLVAVISDAGNGWYRCSVAITTTGANRTVYLWSVDSGSATVNPTSASTGIYYAWGAQFEAVTYETSPRTYNPTTSAAYYGPRFDYNPATLAARGLLIEEARTNLLTYSEQFDNAAWTASNGTITANAIIAPDGTLTANQFIENTATDIHGLQRLFSVSSTAYTHSVFVKKSGRSWVYMDLYDTTSGYAYFNLDTGSVGTTTGGVVASITSVGNGWFRLSATRTVTGTALYFVLRSTTADNTPISLGNGTSGYYAWGAQLELGSFATSYIPTAAASVTRAADSASMTGTNFSSWFNQSEGTFVVNAEWGHAVLASMLLSVEEISTAGAGTNSRWMYAVLNTFEERSAGVLSTQIDGTNREAGSYKRAVAYKVNDFAYAEDGALIGTDTAGAVCVSQDRLVIGGYGGTAWPVNGHIASLTYYKTRLPNAALQSLTTLDPNLLVWGAGNTFEWGSGNNLQWGT